jgi:hypothetical protein
MSSIKSLRNYVLPMFLCGYTSNREKMNTFITQYIDFELFLKLKISKINRF